jgi:Astacin (Peptidase family M12A)/Clostridial hydrophobic W
MKIKLLISICCISLASCNLNLEQKSQPEGDVFNHDYNNQIKTILYTKSNTPDLPESTINSLLTDNVAIVHTFSNLEQIKFYNVGGYTSFSGDILDGIISDLPKIISKRETAIQLYNRQLQNKSIGIKPDPCAISFPSCFRYNGLWNGRVPYVIDIPSFNPTSYDPYRNSAQEIYEVQSAIAFFNKSSPIQFQPRVGLEPYVRIRGDTSCGASVVGKLSSMSSSPGASNSFSGQSLLLGCTNSPLHTYLHEFTHAIGMYHEQQRCDRDRFVEFDAYYDNIYPNPSFLTGSSLKICTTSNQSTDFGKYDYDSVMHYPFGGFMTKIVYPPPSPSEYLGSGSSATTGKLNQLSPGDISGIAQMYNLGDFPATPSALDTRTYRGDNGTLSPWSQTASNNQQITYSFAVGKGIEAFRIKTSKTNELQNKQVELFYRVYVRNKGWLDWTPSGGVAGTTGLGLPLEAIEFDLVALDTNSANCKVRHTVKMSRTGWTPISQARASRSGIIGDNQEIVGFQVGVSCI